VVACAVAYDDVHTSGCADEQSDPDVRVVMARRVDAVDVDGRVYSFVNPGVDADGATGRAPKLGEHNDELLG
jgi:hypothetical protein